MRRVYANLGRWATSLHSSTSLYEPSNEKGLIRLLPGLLGMLGENIDILDKSLGLLDSYLLLDAAGLIQVSTPISLDMRYRLTFVELRSGDLQYPVPSFDRDETARGKTKTSPIHHIPLDTYGPTPYPRSSPPRRWDLPTCNNRPR